MNGAGTAALQQIPTLGFTVDSVEAERHAAAPTLLFTLGIETDGAIRSIMLKAQIRIAAPSRAYDPETQARLADLFGEPKDWGRTLRSLLWTHATALVPPFSGSTTVELPVPCTYDFEVASTKYFQAVEDGDVPLEFLFSGTTFYTDEEGRLRTSLVSWNCEATFRMPVSAWREAIDRSFPGSAWLRVRRDTFERLVAYRTRRTLPTWEAVFDELLEGRE